MNVSRRRYMGEKGGSSPYQRIEYLRATGTQWIDTGIVPDNSLFELETNISVDNANNNQYLCAIAESVSGTTYRFCLLNTNAFFRAFNFSGTFVNNKAAQIATTSNVFHDIHSYIGGGSVGISVGEHTSTVNYNEGWDFANHTLPLFCLKSSGVTPATFMTCYCKYVKIKKGGVLIRDFIPVRVGQVGYMYDTVSGELFGNLGTGSFTLGPDIN